MSGLYVNRNAVGKTYSSLSVLLKTHSSHCPNALLRQSTYYTQKKNRRFFGKVSVLDIRGGVGRSEMLCHAISSRPLLSPLLFHLSDRCCLSFEITPPDAACWLCPFLVDWLWVIFPPAFPPVHMHAHADMATLSCTPALPTPPLNKLCVCARKMGRRSEGG